MLMKRMSETIIIQDGGRKIHRDHPKRLYPATAIDDREGQGAEEEHEIETIVEACRGHTWTPNRR